MTGQITKYEYDTYGRIISLSIVGEDNAITIIYYGTENGPTSVGLVKAVTTTNSIN